MKLFSEELCSIDRKEKSHRLIRRWDFSFLRSWKQLRRFVRWQYYYTAFLNETDLRFLTFIKVKNKNSSPYVT